MTRPTYVHPGLGDAFATVVNQTRSLTAEEADDLQEVYDAHWGGPVDRAGGRVHRALERAGLSRNYDPSPEKAWVYVDQLCGIVGGAADVAQAVLARDHRLINERDFGTLTAWWVDANLQLPDPAPGAGFAPDNAAAALMNRPWFRRLTAVVLAIVLVVAGVIGALSALGLPASRGSLILAAVAAVFAVIGLRAWRRSQSAR